MKAVALLLLSVLLISLSPVKGAITFEVDIMDADYMYGMGGPMNKGKWTDRYLFVRKVIAKAFEHMTRPLTATSSPTIYLNNLVAPMTGRSIANRIITSKTVFFYIEPYVMEGGRMLFSSVGLQNDTRGRTTAAVLSVNLALVDTNTNNLWYYFPMVCREILRAMIFDKSNWLRFYDAARNPEPKLLNETINNGSVAGSTRYYFNNSAVNSAFQTSYSNATEYYKGIILEDQGDDMVRHNGWEQALYPNDILSTMPVQPIALSYFSFATGNAAGWYTVQSGSYYRMSFHGLGTNSADFGKDKCLPSNSFGSCTSLGAKTCGPDYESKTECVKGDFSNDCMFQKATDVCYLNNTGAGANSIEKFGRNSRCVMGSINGGSDIPLCLNVTSYTAASTTITFQDSNGASYACTGSDITVGSVTIRCPTVTTYTNRIAASCTNDCNGNGICLFSESSTHSNPSSASCFCFWGFSGTACNVRNVREENFIIRNPYMVADVGFRKMNSMLMSLGALFSGLFIFFSLN